MSTYARGGGSIKSVHVRTRGSGARNPDFLRPYFMDVFQNFDTEFLFICSKIIVGVAQS